MSDSTPIMEGHGYLNVVQEMVFARFLSELDGRIASVQTRIMASSRPEDEDLEAELMTLRGALRNMANMAGVAWQDLVRDYT
jgi:hypothetical protein